MRFTLVIGICLTFWSNNLMAARSVAYVTENSFWESHSVVFGEIESVEKLDSDSKSTHRILFRPKATLSGIFDPGLHSEFHLKISVSIVRSFIREEPHSEQKIILVIREYNDSFSVPSQYIPFMPDGAAFVRVSGLDDPKVEQTLCAIQVVRGTVDVKAPSFWENHSVVLGEIESVTVMPRDQSFEGSHRIVFRPHKTLLGTFDPKRHPKLHVNLWAAWWVYPFREQPRAEQKVMLVLQKHDDSFRVLPCHYPFMPDGAAFVLLSDFNDPKVEQTLSAIQELSKQEEKQEKEGRDLPKQGEKREREDQNLRKPDDKQEALEADEFLIPLNDDDDDRDGTSDVNQLHPMTNHPVPIPSEDDLAE